VTVREFGIGRNSQKTNNIQIKRKNESYFFHFFTNFVVLPGEIAKPNIEVKCVKIRRI
jgi:hypothetical protein